MNKYLEDLQEAAQIARQALPLATQFSLPANPLNYTVLYEYVSGKNQELSTAIDQLRKTPDSLTNEQMASFYQSYVSDTDEEGIKEARNALSAIVNSTLGSLDRVAQESQTYHENLGEAAEQLTGSESGNSLDIVAKLIDETVRMQAASRSLEEELSKTNQDLNNLRSEFQRVQEESLVDGLTGIKNRRAFDEALASAQKQTITSNEVLSLLLIDIDFFKKVNDTHGHVVGDAVLKQVANAINESVRGGDVLARYGGEEFAVLLPSTTMDGAEHVADNICNKVRNQKMDRATVGKDIGRVTVSVGVALFSNNEAGEEFIARADTALYRAKESGRNRVCTCTVE